MATRKAIEKAPATLTGRRKVVADQAASSYFAGAEEKVDLMFTRSGCSLLDCAYGGGMVLGRWVNLVGDRSSGKTLLAIEACANFARDYPNGDIRYAEVEAAFDKRYAGALGMPLERVKFASKDGKRLISTVQDFSRDLTTFCESLKGRPGIYVLDSLDAISDEAEIKRSIEDPSFGAEKAKKMGELLRRLVDMVEQEKVLVIVISQLRDKIGVTFGEKQTRSGGRALDFYCTHIVWLREKEKLKRTIDKVERVIGVQVHARIRKNKVGLPFRECEFPVLFGYGIDDLTAMVEWLLEVGREDLLAKVDMSKGGYQVRLRTLRNKGGDEVRAVRKALDALVAAEWRDIELKFLPQASKY